VLKAKGGKMRLIAIDPGTTQSAIIIWDTRYGEILQKEILPNDELLRFLREFGDIYDNVVIEGIASYGMPVGASVFETCYMIGRIMEIAHTYELVYRKDIKMHFCGTTRAKDGNIRQALIDRFGAPGTKKNPNPITYGIKKDLWSALAVGVFFADTKTKKGDR